MKDAVETKEAPVTAPLIITHFDMRFPVLSQKSLPCGIPLSSDDLSIVNRMKEELVKLGVDAVGLAGVQIGVARNIFLMKRQDGTILECVNPRILNVSRELSKKPEGCLSIPQMIVKVARPKQVTLEYYDIYGCIHETIFHGLEAKIVCHEMDHLNGVMINSHLEIQMEKNERLNNERKTSLEKAKLKRRKMAKLHKKNNRRR